MHPRDSKEANEAGQWESLEAQKMKPELSDEA